VTGSDVGTLPETMQWLPRDRRGFPIPAFVGTNPQGQRDYRHVDETKRTSMMFSASCGVCGKPFPNHETVAFVGGVRAASTLTYRHLPMHLDCAVATLRLHPYLFDEDGLFAPLPNGQWLSSGQPGCFVMVLSRAWKVRAIGPTGQRVSHGSPGCTELFHPAKLQEVRAYICKGGDVHVMTPRSLPLELAGRRLPGEIAPPFEREHWLSVIGSI